MARQKKPVHRVEMTEAILKICALSLKDLCDRIHRRLCIFAICLDFNEIPCSGLQSHQFQDMIRPCCFLPCAKPNFCIHFSRRRKNPRGIAGMKSFRILDPDCNAFRMHSLHSFYFIK